MITVPPSPLRTIELVFGAVLGMDPNAPAIAPGEFPVEKPKDAFRSVIYDALKRGPCFVAFSGGRDSSTVMAVAVDVAREAGLALPVPLINVMPHLPETEESEWQDLVLDHLGVKERVLIHRAPDSDEIFGPDGIESLTTIGVSYPPNARSLLSVIRRATGGTLMTGAGGDELGQAASTRWAARALAAGSAPARTRLAARLPRTAGAARFVRTFCTAPTHEQWVSPWLTRRALLLLRAELARVDAVEPMAWDELLTQHFSCTRYRTRIEKSMTALAAPYDVQMVHPLWDRRTVAALAAAHPLQGYPSRAAILEDIAGSLLPQTVTRRTTKADFSATPWGPEAEDLIANWDGGGVPHDLVDVDSLRREWSLPVGDRTGTSIPLLQSVWLSSRGITS